MKHHMARLSVHYGCWGWRTTSANNAVALAIPVTDALIPDYSFLSASGADVGLPDAGFQ